MLLQNSADRIKSSRKEAGLTTKQAAALLKVKEVTFQRWEGQTSRVAEIPYAHWNLFLLLTDRHPVYRLVERGGNHGHA